MTIKIYEGKLGKEYYLDKYESNYIPHKGEYIRFGDTSKEEDEVYEIINVLYDNSSDNGAEINLFVKLYDWDN